MLVQITRHSTAIPYGRCDNDAHRHLTAEGRIRAKRVATRLIDENLVPAKIAMSPFVRATQTAEIISASCGVENIAVHVPLGIDLGSTADALGIVDESWDEPSIMLVSHQPKVERMMRHLLNRDDLPSFATASVCGIEVDKNGHADFSFWIDGRSGELFRSPETVPR